MKNNINKIIDRFFFWLWVIVLYLSTMGGFAIIIEQIKFLRFIEPINAGILFATFSFYYILYKFGKKEENRE